MRAFRMSLLVGVSGALAACETVGLAPDAPKALADSRPSTVLPALPPLPPSVVDAPITYHLESALAALERSAPRAFGNLDQRIAVPSSPRRQIAFHATRTPFVVGVDGQRLTLTTIVTYQGRGWYNPLLGPTISSSCGTDGPAPRVRVVLTTDIDVTPTWSLTSRTRVRSVTPVTDTPRDQCLVTPFKIDVTERVTKTIRLALNKKLSSVDRRIAAFDVRGPIERWYNLLNRSLHVRDSLWLTLAPAGVRLGAIGVRDTTLALDVRLYAHPSLAYGRRPPQLHISIPPFQRAERPVGDSVMLRLEGLLTYDDASAFLTKTLAGRKFRRFNRAVTISNVRLYAIGDGRVVVDLRVSGDITGNAYFLGTPKLDTAARTLTVPDLDFDVGTSDALVQGLAWFRKADIVAELRKRASIPLGPPLEVVRSAAELVLDRELTTGVRLTGRIHTGRMIDVVAQTRWIVVRAEATGSIALHIDRPLAASAGRTEPQRRDTAVRRTTGK